MKNKNAHVQAADYAAKLFVLAQKPEFIGNQDRKIKIGR